MCASKSEFYLTSQQLIAVDLTWFQAFCFLYTWQSSEKVKVKVAQSCPTLCNPKDYTVSSIWGLFFWGSIYWVASQSNLKSSGQRPHIKSFPPPHHPLCECLVHGHITHAAEINESPLRFSQSTSAHRCILTVKSNTIPTQHVAGRRTWCYTCNIKKNIKL